MYWKMARFSNWKFRLKNINKCVFEISQDTYIHVQWCQTRIIYQTLGTNVLLLKMQIIKTDQCSFYKNDKETLLHLFWECTYTQSLITEILKAVKLLDADFYINAKLFILGYTNRSLIHFNILCLE